MNTTTDKWGWRHKSLPDYPFHYGTDNDVGIGTRVNAIMDGTVLYSKFEPTNGEQVMILHTVNGQSYITWYSHLSKRSVSVGTTSNPTKVKAGDKIGESGETGTACFGAHLHFGIAKTASTASSDRQSKGINPLNIYAPDDTRGTSTNPQPLFKLVNGAYVYNTSFDWSFSTNPMPERYSQDVKYKKK